MTKSIVAAQDLWFLNTRVAVRVSYEDGTDQISLLEHQAPYGDSPPLHLHRNQDEVFHVLEGDLRFVIRGDELRAGPGQTLIVPQGTPHTYRIDSLHGGRWLTVTVGKDFERFVRALGRVAERDGLPDPSGPPTPEQVHALAIIARQFGIEIVGPPLV